MIAELSNTVILFMLHPFGSVLLHLPGISIPHYVPLLEHSNSPILTIRQLCVK